MKMKQKMMSVFLAACMVISVLSMSAMATDVEDYPIEVVVMTKEETLDRFGSLTRSVSGTGTAYLPKNNISGTNGNPCAPFTADTTSVSFVITNAPGATTYNVQLYAGSPGSGYRVATYTPDVPINNGASFYNLTVGTSYYFVISSNDVGNGGCTATYSFTTF